MGRIINDSGFKFESRTVTDDQSALCWVKWNPDVTTIADGSTAVTAARMQVQANLVNFDLNGTADTEVGTYSGNTGGDDEVVLADAGTVQGLLDRINGVVDGATAGTAVGITRYIAGLGDFRPQFVIGTGDGLAVALTNILLGKNNSPGGTEGDGLEVFADSSALASADTIAVAIGTSRARDGAGAQIPDLRALGYTSTTAGVTTKVRESIRSREEHPFTTTFETRLTGVTIAALHATTKIVTVYDDAGNTLYTEALGAATVLDGAERFNFDNPIAVAQGPIFVELTGTGGLTDGNLMAQGYVRVA